MAKSLCIILSVLILACFLISPAFAADPAPPDTSMDSGLPPAKVEPPSQFEIHLREYAKLCSEKLDLGVPNLFMGWTTIFSEPAKHYQKKASFRDNTNSMLPFVGRGLLLFPIDTVGGALNMATFPIPWKIPLPDGGMNLAPLTGENSPPAEKTLQRNPA